MVRRVVVHRTHQSSNLRFYTGVSNLRRNMFLVGGDVPIDTKVSAMCSSILRPNLSVRSFGVAHRGRICVCASIRVSVWLYARVCYRFCCIVFRKTKGDVHKNMPIFLKHRALCIETT